MSDDMSDEMSDEMSDAMSDEMSLFIHSSSSLDSSSLIQPPLTLRAVSGPDLRNVSIVVLGQECIHHKHMQAVLVDEGKEAGSLGGQSFAAGWN